MCDAPRARWPPSLTPFCPNWDAGVGGFTLARSDSMLAARLDGSPDPVEAGDRLLLDRIRLGGKLMLAGIATFFVGELVLHSGARPLISVVQGTNLAVVALALYLVRESGRRGFNTAAGGAAYTITIVSGGAVAVLRSQ